LGLLLGIGLGEFFLDRELDFNLRIFRMAYRDGSVESDGRFVRGSFASKFEIVLSGLCFEAYAAQGEPGFRRGVVAEGEIVSEPGAGQGGELGCGFHLEQHRCAIDRANGLGADSPGRGRSWNRGGYQGNRN
jgi:hypothetical protein